MEFGCIMVNIMCYTAKLGYVEEVYFVNMLQETRQLFDMQILLFYFRQEPNTGTRPVPADSTCC